MAINATCVMATTANANGLFRHNEWSVGISGGFSSPVAAELIAEADVVVNNFRAGVMERMGLGYEDCRALNPRIIYAVGTGFGESGPNAHKGGQDVLAQAMSGQAPYRLQLAKIEADGKPVCNGGLTFRVVDFPKGEFLDNMHAVARRIAFPMEAMANG